MSEQLKPCPFCGGEAHIDGTSWRPTDGAEVAWVTCKRCDAYGPTLPLKEAIAAKAPRTVPDGQTPLDDNLNHRLLDVIREGEAARDAGTGSPYHGHSLEHCLHATGWVSRDLRLALNESHARAEAAEAERDRVAAEWAETSQRNYQRAKAAEAERDALRAAGDRLSVCAQTTGGTAGRDDGLVDAITGWKEARQALKGDDQ